MKRFWHGRSLYLTLAALLIGGAVTLIYLSGQSNNNARIVGIVDEGPVRQVVSVTGAIEAENTAEMGFAVGGIVEKVHVRKGDVVATGTPLITLSAAALRADVLDAQAAVAAARADRAELLAGARGETRAVSSATVRLKEEALVQARANEAAKIEAAKRTLLSSGLAASSNEANESATAPVISGTYQCAEEGTYTITLYSSSAASGYSARLSGLENGTFPASSDQAIAFGTCGLRLQITPDENYHNSVWYVEVPNTKATTYTTNKNAYELALSSAKNTIDRAERELAVARAEGAVTTAPARIEEVARANATVAQAEARLAHTVANQNNATLIAPFSGTIVSIDAVAGEAVSTAPVVTLLSPERYELIARIPEIDVGKLNIGQNADIVFDTATDETLRAQIDFIAPSAVVIDGVAYYEARLNLTTLPPWLRSGLNADVDIIISEKTGLRVPRRFLSEVNGTYSVLRLDADDTLATSTVEVSLIGNDGFVALSGLRNGDLVVAP
ncbi:HlyD family efflux transporter periplasmic adaptor subunit [Patescibacteria group bacterium]|nr:HlyD family efflux transporter periplasmic adaptor subunit [Patescibacteria group bacterium]